MFPCGIWEDFQNSYFTENLRVSALKCGEWQFYEQDHYRDSSINEQTEKYE